MDAAQVWRVVRHCSDELRGFFSGLLKRFDRIVVTGPSGCGKSTLANEVQIDDRPILRSDDFKHIGFEDVPFAIIESAKHAGPRWVAEGVMLPRALRKGLECDAVVYLDKPRRPQLRGQEIQGRGMVGKVFTEWRYKNPSVPVFRLPEDA